MGIVVVHSAALHGIHLAAHSLRVLRPQHDGTFNVWQAAVAHRIGGVVFSSTMGVYGESRQPSAGDDVTFLDEDVHLRPGDIYGWTKAAGEELCRYHLRERIVPVGGTARTAIVRYMGKRGAGAPDEPLFLGRRGALDWRGMQQVLKRLKGRAGITGRCSPHSLRHTFARS